MGNCWCQCFPLDWYGCDYGQCCGGPLLSNPTDRPDVAEILANTTSRRQYLKSLVGDTILQRALTDVLPVGGLVKLIEGYADRRSVLRTELDVYEYIQTTVGLGLSHWTQEPLDVHLLRPHLRGKLGSATVEQLKRIMTRHGPASLFRHIKYAQLSFGSTPEQIQLRRHYITVMGHHNNPDANFDDLALVCHQCGSRHITHMRLILEDTIDTVYKTDTNVIDGYRRKQVHRYEDWCHYQPCRYKRHLRTEEVFGPERETKAEC